MAKASKATRQDYRSLDNDGLAGKISEEELRLKKTKFSHAVNPIENPLSIKIIRREIARMKTESRKRELGF
jgi:large subunit ribosomal protein L29